MHEPQSEGRLFGRYRVEALLGAGGMGRVYRATDTVLRRPVALKLLGTEADPAAGEAPPGHLEASRMMREARAAAAFSHPNVVAIYDVGEVDGQPFIAMELVEGRCLRKLIADATISLDQRLRWVHEIACALEAAHRASVVHRDIKPENVIVGADGRARVLDFGIAKLTHTSTRDTGAETVTVTGQAPASFRTEEGCVVGTPRYMAPERFGEEALDARSDQFAWGLVAFETISGSYPFARTPGLAAAPLLSDLLPSLPFGVAAIVAKAIELDPARRFESMDAVVRALAPLIHGAPGEAVPPLVPEHAALVGTTQTVGDVAGRRAGPVVAPSTVRLTLAALAVVMCFGGVSWAVHENARGAPLESPFALEAAPTIAAPTAAATTPPVASAAATVAPMPSSSATSAPTASATAPIGSASGAHPKTAVVPSASPAHATKIGRVSFPPSLPFVDGVPPYSNALVETRVRARTEAIVACFVPPAFTPGKWSSACGYIDFDNRGDVVRILVDRGDTAFKTCLADALHLSLGPPDTAKSGQEQICLTAW